MAEHLMLNIVTVLVTIACCLLAILITSLRNWKKDIKAIIDGIRNEFKEDIDKTCNENKAEHIDLWDRVNHHWHNGGGNVVIPGPSGGKRP